MAELAIVVSAKNQAGAALGSLQGQLAGVERQVNGLKAGLQSAGQALQGFGAGMSLGVTAPLAGMGLMAINAASDLNESMSKVDVVFGENAAEIQAWSETPAEGFGQSRQQALEAAGTFGNLFDALGMSEAATAEMSTGLVELASDLASFNNIDPPEALEKLRAGIVGETEPLRTLGVNLTAAAVEAKALEMNLAASAKELTESDKVTARYALIMESTANAQGDFARTADGLANSQRILTAELADASANLGTMLLPYMLQAVQAVSQLVVWFGALSPEMQQFAVIGAVAAAAIGPLAGILGTVLTVVSALISPIGLVVVAVGLLAGAWAMNLGGIQEFTAALTGGLQPAIEAISSGAVSLESVLGELGAVLLGIGTDTYDTTDNIRDLTLALTGSQDAANQVEAGLRTIGATLQGFGAQVALVAGMVGAFLAPALANVQTAFGEMMTGFAGLGPQVEGLGVAFGNLLTAVEPIATVIGVGLVVAFDLLLNTLAEVMRVLPTVVGNAMTLITMWINLMAANIKNTIALVQAMIAGDWDSAWKLAQQIAKDNFGFIEQAFRTLWSNITLIGASILTAIKNTFNDMLAYLTSLNLPNPFAGFKGVIDAVVTAIGKVQTMINNLSGFLSGLSFPNPFAGWSFPEPPDWVKWLMGGGGSGGTGNNAIGSQNWRGGMTMVGETGPELVMLPRGSRIFGAQETQRMAAAPAGVAVTVESMVVRSEMDIHEIAYRVADLLARG